MYICTYKYRYICIYIHFISSLLDTPSICVTWRVHMCDMTQLWLCCGLVSRSDQKKKIGETWELFTCVTWLIYIFDTTQSYAWHGVFTCVTWRIHMCDMTHSHMCDMPRWRVWHDVCDMTGTHTHKRPWNTQERPVYTQKRPVHTLKRDLYTHSKEALKHSKPVYTQKRPVYIEKRPVYTQKRPVHTLKRDLYTLKRDVYTHSKETCKCKYRTLPQRITAQKRRVFVNTWFYLSAQPHKRDLYTLENDHIFMHTLRRVVLYIYIYI